MVVRNAPAWVLLSLALAATGCLPRAVDDPDDADNCGSNGLPSVPCVPADSLDENTNSFVFGAGTIIAPDVSTAFMMALDGGLDAVDLTTGALRWHSAAAAKPLLVRGAFVAAQAEQADPLRVVLLDIATHGQTLLTADSDLPADVHASVVDGLETSFRSSALVAGETLYVSWVFTERDAGGVDPGTNGVVRTVTGAVRIDLNTGGVSSIGVENVPDPEERPLPDNVQDLVDTGSISGPLWRADGILATLATSGAESILQRWNADTGVMLPEITLFGAERTFRTVSADQRHVLASRFAGAGNLWTWSIFSLATGTSLPEVAIPGPGAVFFVLDDILYYESPAMERTEGEQVIVEPIKLHAIRLDTGTQLWEHARRDTAYHGAFPPGMP